VQTIFTFTAVVKPDRVGKLQTYLTWLGKKANAHEVFSTLSQLHFASLLAVPAVEVFPAYLVFENNIDGTVPAYIEALCAAAPKALHVLCSFCVGYEAKEFDLGTMRSYLAAHVLRPDASFVANLGRDVNRIHEENRLMLKLEGRIDELPPYTSPQIYNKLHDYASDHAGWALRPKGRLPVAETFKREFVNALLFLFGLAVVVFAWPLTLAYILILRAHEIADADKEPPLLRDAQKFADYGKTEDVLAQNHFASLSFVKPGFFRRFTIRGVLFVVNRIACVSFKGSLTGLTNIHFAQWVLLDEGRRLLFLTNYDGSWENYLDDFIDEAASGLTAIWSNVRNFPRTWFLTGGGARDERPFKAVSRESEIVAPVWYSAYPSISVLSIDNSSAIRDGLATRPEGKELEAWLQLL